MNYWILSMKKSRQQNTSIASAMPVSVINITFFLRFLRKAPGKAGTESPATGSGTAP